MSEQKQISCSQTLNIELKFATNPRRAADFGDNSLSFKLLRAIPFMLSCCSFMLYCFHVVIGYIVIKKIVKAINRLSTVMWAGWDNFTVV